MYKSVKLWLYSFFVPFFIDRITKYLVVSDVLFDQTIFSFLNVYETYNRGISWGLGNSDHQGLFVLISGLVATVIIGFCWYVYTIRLQSTALFASLVILSGALSNFIDRLWFGGVVDFIQFHWNQYFFPVFNVADACIFMGTCLLLYAQIKHDLLRPKT